MQAKSNVYRIPLAGEQDPTPGAPLTQGQWQTPTGGEVSWLWQRPTRVYGIEVRNQQENSYIVSVQCDGEEQLASSPVPADVFREGTQGMRLVLPIMEPGIEFRVKFTGPARLEIRPVGEQVL
jgi:hypothetical protein